MNYREDLIELFRVWSSKDEYATISFLGYEDGLPKYIFVYDFTDRSYVFALQDSYLDYLKNLFGENILFCQNSFADSFLFCKSPQNCDLRIKGGCIIG